MTDLHDEIASMFALYEGQTYGLAANGGGYLTCHAPPTDNERAYKARWMREWRARNPRKAKAAVSRKNKARSRQRKSMRRTRRAGA